MSVESVVSTVEELLPHLDPLLSQCGGDVSSMLNYLQDVDSDWEQYSLITWLRDEIRTAMLDLVRREVGGGAVVTPRTMTGAAPGVLQRLMSDDRWERLVEKVQTRLRTATAIVTNNMNQEKDGAWATPDATQTDTISLGSTWSQANFIFVQPDQIALLAQQLEEGQPEAARTAALNTLLLTGQLSDMVESQHWDGLRRGLAGAAADTNPAVADLALKIHTRLVGSGQHFAIKEGYVSLVQTVAGWYQVSGE